YSTSWSSSTTKVTIEGFTDSYSITTSGALASFMTVFDVLKEVDISTILNKKIPSLPSGLDGWLSSETAKNLFEDSYIRSLTYTYLPDLVELGLDKVSSIPSFASDLVDYCDFSFLIKKNSNGSYVYDSATITKELSVYYHLLSQVKKIGLSNLKSMAKRITALTDKELECLDTIIDLVGDSFVLTDIKPGKDMSPMAKGLSVVLDKVNGTSNDILSMMTISDSETESKNILKAMLISLDTNNLWSEELGRFATILHKMQGMDYKSTDLFAAGRNYDSMSGLLSSMNESILMHKAPIYLFKTAFNSISGLTDLLENNGLLTHPLDFDTHTTASDEDVAYWAHDYELLLSLVYKEDTFAKIIKDKLDLSSMDFGSDGISTSILYYIGSMNLFKYNRSYFLYNLISNYKDSEGEPIYSTIFKNSSSTPYGEDASAYRIEDLLFSNPELLDNDGYIDQEKMLAETDMIDKLINNVLTKALTLQQVTSIEEVYNALKNEDGSFSFFEDLTEMTLRLDTDENDVTSLYRSAFCSELVAGCMNIVTKNESLAQYLGIFSTLDFYANDYALINPIEGKTLDASIILGYELSNGENLGTIDNATLRLPYDNEGIKGYYDIPVASMIYFTDEAIVSLFRRLQATSDDSEIIQFIAANDPNYAVCNSKLAYIMATAKKADNIVKYSFTNPFTQQVIELTFGPYSTLGYLPVLISNSTVGYLGDVLDFNNLNSKTFLELINLDN
ncbi:MAG: hypothetical protein WCR67_05250, partial [Bacilli bacterium]